MSEEQEFKELHNSIYGGGEGDYEPKDPSDYEEDVSTEEPQDSEGEVAEESKEASDAKYKFKLKIDGEEIEEEFDDESIKNALQKSKKFDQKMTKLDLERKAFLKEQEEVTAFLKAQSELIEKGKFLSELEKTDPNIRQRILGVQPKEVKKEVDFNERYNEILDLAESEYKDVPIIKKMAELVTQQNRMHASEMEKIKAELAKANEGVGEFKEEKKLSQEAYRKQVQQNNAKALEDWSRENGITINPNEDRFVLLDEAFRAGKDLVKTAKILYALELSQKPVSTAPEKRTVIEEVQPVKIKPSGKSRTHDKGEYDDALRGSIYGRK